MILAVDTYINSLMPLLHNAFTNPFFITLTTLFDAEVFLLWFLPLLGLLVYKRRYFASGFLFFGVAGGQTIKIILKYLTDKPRPENPFGLSVHESSFPSGHATTSVFLFMAVYYLLTPHISTRWRKYVQALLIFGMLAVPFSRLFVQVHYASDVIAGMLLGGASFAFTWFVFTYYKKWYIK